MDYGQQTGTLRALRLGNGKPARAADMQAARGVLLYTLFWRSSRRLAPQDDAKEDIPQDGLKEDTVQDEAQDDAMGAQKQYMKVR